MLCKKCNTEQELSNFQFYPSNHPTRANKIKFPCKSCRAEYQKNYTLHGCNYILPKTKICVECKVEKEIINFPINGKDKKTGFAYPRCRCRSCDNLEMVYRGKLYKLKAVNYLGGKCSICGYCKNINALDFHHLDPTKKDISIADLRKVNTEDMHKELNKCILLCSNCHREEHSKQHLINLRKYLSFRRNANEELKQYLKIPLELLDD